MSSRSSKEFAMDVIDTFSCSCSIIILNKFPGLVYQPDIKMSDQDQLLSHMADLQKNRGEVALKVTPG